MKNTYEQAQSVIMNTYNRFPLVFESGDGMYITDENGKTYLDFVAGIAVNSLGHANKKLANAISEQANTLIHCSNLYWTKPQISFAQKIISNSSFSKIFFCNSGAEANEAAIKISRKYGGAKGKFEIVTLKNSFHGRTMGAVTATGQEKYHKGFAPMLSGIKYALLNDFESLKQTVTDKTCAVFIEPIQAEGGIHPCDFEYLKQVRNLCDEMDMLLVYDEVQCGLGRTGKLFASQYFGVEPDVVSIAKGIAGGFPMGAMLVNERADVFAPGEHASTFGGSPLACAAASVVIDELTSSLCANAENQGHYLTSKLNALKEKFDIIIDVRGVGLIQGIELSVLVSPIISKCIENGLLLVSAGTNVIRFVPALIVTEEDIDKMIDILEESLATFSN